MISVSIPVGIKFNITDSVQFIKATLVSKNKLQRYMQIYNKISGVSL